MDPPYNTGNDSFNYNDSFNHSTWLVFMKNRLELARRLLSEDGVIFVNLDYNEVHYCKVLIDSIFGRQNFINEIIWRYRTYIGQVKTFFPRKHDNILWYKKNNLTFFNQSNVGNYEDTPDYKRWKQYLNNNGEISYGNHPVTDSRFTAYLKKYISQFGEPNDIIYKNSGYVIDDVWEDIIALDAKNKSERIELFSGSGQKPEALIQRILNSTTKENDLILDFFLGSGTTAAVAHKMNRRYIGIEQMDYIQDITIERLKKVIDGEQGMEFRNQLIEMGVICILWIAWKYKFFNFANPRCKQWKHYNH
ncbi:site-specific DNA-methyltransferase [Mycoplasmopsis felis]|uniref:site-specific DNA-methyltransferase n=1 Tax=Mycoplasmopsis felis TaxID=33923 RepID=UPI002FF11B9C